MLDSFAWAACLWKCGIESPFPADNFFPFQLGLLLPFQLTIFS
jgi:hypothetical protein